MTKTEGRNRVLDAVAACRPLSTNGAFLLERYMQAADSPANNWPPGERYYLYELCRLVEQCELDVLTIAALRQTTGVEGLSGRARRRRGRLVGRIIRILQVSGELPTQRQLRDSRATSRILYAAPAASRRFLGEWEAVRREFVGAFELRHEIRRLALLERIGARNPDAADEYLLDRWLRLQTRQIVDCRCAPVTRADDPFTCACCGRTAATTGTRPSPGPRKQREIRSIGRRYLEFRRANSWMGLAA